MYWKFDGIDTVTGVIRLQKRKETIIFLGMKKLRFLLPNRRRGP
jgi:hypothetical protein